MLFDSRKIRQQVQENSKKESSSCSNSPGSTATQSKFFSSSRVGKTLRLGFGFVAADKLLTEATQTTWECSPRESFSSSFCRGEININEPWADTVIHQLSSLSILTNSTRICEILEAIKEPQTLIICCDEAQQLETPFRMPKSQPMLISSLTGISTSRAVHSLLHSSFPTSL